MNIKKIVGSVIVASGVFALGIVGTRAFFSDEETSTGNSFVAGALDLKIDNQSYAIDFNIVDFEGTPSGVLVSSPGTSWTLADLDEQVFFDFIDLKPGDFGEDTISIHVDNDAWLCMDWETTTTPENDVLSPEEDAGDDLTNGDQDGELQDFINFVWWVDDGDNVLEDDEDESAIFSGTLAEMSELSVALADSSDQSVNDGPIPAGATENDVFYIGKAWCFGELTLNPVGADQGENPTVNPGILCNGENPAEDPDLHNIAQTDSVHGNLSFRAVQARHNSEFVCNPVE